MEIDQIIRMLAMRKNKLKEDEALLANHPDYEILKKMLRNQQTLVKNAELKLNLYIKKKELELHRSYFEMLDRGKEDSYCPACKHAYEAPDGRKLTEEEVTGKDVLCPLHPEREPGGYCPDFIEAFDMKDHFKNNYKRIKLARQVIQETEQDISKLEKELGSMKLEGPEFDIPI